MTSPQVGFNNNVKHRGRVFHIQTEDSGVSRPHITTHLFADGGLILKSCRSDYSDVLERPDMVAILRKRMKDQHKAMFIDLREGKLDPVIDEILGGSTAALTSAARDSATPKPRKVRSQPPARRSSRAPAGRSRPVVSVPASVPVRASAPSPPGAVQRLSNPPAISDAGAPLPAPTSITSVSLSLNPGSGRYAPTRPSASFNSPDSSSIFGGSSISEQSLDDVILSYISADLDGSQNTGE